MTSNKDMTIVNNPLATQDDRALSSKTAVEQSRATMEVQALVAMAKRFPRDEVASMNRILKACTRPTLAEAALYAYPRGGTIVTGPSIRLAEAIAQSWGNVNFGIVEVEQRNGESSMISYAWDLETNTRTSREFIVKHERKAKGKIVKLTDPRDIYELAANLGARRLRSCILNLIPGDVVDAAVQQCEETQNNHEGATKEQIDKLIEAFATFNVDEKALTKYLQHPIKKAIGAELVNLRRIYRSLADGMAKPADFFDVAAEPTTASDEQATQALNE